MVLPDELWFFLTEDPPDIPCPVEHALDEQCLFCRVVENKVAVESAHTPNVEMLEPRMRGLIPMPDIKGLCQSCKRFLRRSDKPP